MTMTLQVAVLLTAYYHFINIDFDNVNRVLNIKNSVVAIWRSSINVPYISRVICDGNPIYVNEIDADVDVSAVAALD